MASAHVTSLDALRDLRVALIRFADECHETMVGLEMELRRGLQWLLEDQPKFWKNEERRLHDRVLEARQELSRCKSMALPGERAPCSEQKHALERAIAQLRHAEEKSKITKHWGRIIDHESHEWQGRSNQFLTLLEGELPQAIALVDRAILALEAYLQPSSMSGNASRNQVSGSGSGGASETDSKASDAMRPDLPSTPELPPFPGAADAPG